MNKDLTELVLVLDRSGSMNNCVQETESGAKELIQDQKDEPGNVNVTYYRFNTNVEKVYESVDIHEIGEIKLEPSGMTALYDGIGVAISEVGQRLAKTPEDQRPGLIVVAIMTDGFENMSQEYDSTKVHKMIKHQTDKYGWQFIFLGANQDSFAVGGSMGIDAGKISNYATSKSSLAYKGTSDVIKSMRGVSMHGGSVADLSACSFSDESRAEMSNDEPSVKTDQSLVQKAKSIISKWTNND